MKNLNQGIYDSEVTNNQKIALDIYKKLNLGGSDPLAYQHIISVLKLFFQEKLPLDGLGDIIFDCALDGQMDAIFVDKNKIYIFDIKRSDSFEAKDINAFLKSVKKNIFENNIDKNLHPKLVQKLKRIQRIKNKEIYLVIFRNAQKNKPSISEPEFNKFTSFKKINVINIDDLIKKITEDKVKFPTFKIKLNQVSHIDDNKPIKEEVFLKINIKDLLKHKEAGEKIGADFFYKNVRNPNFDPAFKSELLVTLSQYKEKFHLLHNGITLISDSSITVDNGFYIITNPQIVNGAQTVGLLHQIQKEKKFNFDGVYLYCKVLEADSDLAKKVCETANTQKPVNIWELRAHDELHIKLEKYFTPNYSYQRKKTKTSLRTKIKLDLFIQWAYAAFFKKPWLVKTSKKSLFKNPTDENSTYSKIDKKLSTCDVIEIERLVESADFVEKFIKDASSRKKGFLRVVRFYLISFVYHKNEFRKKELIEVVMFLLELSQKIKKQSKVNITDSMIFNQKGDVVWNKLAKRYAIK